MDDDITSLDLYDLLGVQLESDVQEIKKAYRKKALTCHPDKNPDDPNAVKEFLQLTRALDLLINEKSRAVYNKVLSARKAAQLRHQALDSKRKKFKEELEAREREAESASASGPKKSNEQTLKDQIERLRKEGSVELRQEIELMRKKVMEELSLKMSNNRVKVRWTVSKNVSSESNSLYDYKTLHTLFSKYGSITALVVSHSKRNSALIEYSNPEAARSAIQEKGFLKNPLRVTLVGGGSNCEDSHVEPSNVVRRNKSSNSHTTEDNLADFEKDVLTMLKRAQERRNAAKMENAEKDQETV